MAEEEASGESLTCTLCRECIATNEDPERYELYLAKQKMLVDSIESITFQMGSMENTFKSVDCIVGNLPVHFECDSPREKLLVDVINALQCRVNALSISYKTVETGIGSVKVVLDLNNETDPEPAYKIPRI